MKKFFTLIVAMMAIVGTASAETVELTPYAPNQYWGSKCVGWGTIDFNSQWGEYKLYESTVPVGEYTSVTINYTDAENVQMIIVGDYVVSEESWGKSYETLYVPMDETGTTTREITFAEGQSQNLQRISIQGTQSTGSVKMVSMTLHKADGTDVVVDNGAGISWGCTYTTSNFLFTDDNGEVAFKETLPSPEEGKALKLVFSFEPATSGTVQEKVEVPETSRAVTLGLAQQSSYDQKYYAYGSQYNFTASVEECKETTTMSYELTNITYMGLKGTQINNVKAYYEIIDSPASAINTVSADAASTKAVKTIQNGKVVIMKNGNKYNAAGQLLK